MTRRLQVSPWYSHQIPTVIAVIAVVACAVIAGGVAAVLLIEEPEHVIETRTVTETPRECFAALDEADRALVVGTEFGRAMVGLRDVDQGVHHFTPGGLHDQDSRRFLETMTAAAEAFRAHKTACLAPANGDRSDG